MMLPRDIGSALSRSALGEVLGGVLEPVVDPSCGGGLRLKPGEAFALELGESLERVAAVEDGVTGATGARRYSSPTGCRLFSSL